MRRSKAFLRRLGLVVFAMMIGAIGALAQAPFSIAPLIILMMALGFFLLDRQATILGAAALGWLVGLGYFMVSLHWIVSPFQVNAQDHAWMAPFAIGFMGAGMALFWAGAFALARAFGAAWVLVLTWPLAEMLRAYIFTGFPWAAPPQALVDVLAGQALAILGPHGLMILMCAAAFGLYHSLYRQLIAHLIFGAALLAVLVAPPLRDPVQSSGKIIRLVQPNIAQADKWKPENSQMIVERLLGFTQEGARPDLIVWPETALPYLADQARPLFPEIAKASGGAPVAFGILRQQQGAYYNAMLLLDSQGEIEAKYDKHHLVPFGEYIPFRRAFNWLGLKNVADIFGEGFAVGAGAELIDFGPLGRALPLICYEAVFAHDVNAAPERATFLLHLTNDAWFGNFAGPHQHLALAQMRAIEQGLPLARAANTGISAMIDPYGRITAQLDLNQSGYVDAQLPQPLGATFYSLVGDLPFGVFLLLGLGFSARSLRKRKNY